MTDTVERKTEKIRPGNAGVTHRARRMDMGHGGKREGAGRPKGSLGVKTIVSQDIAVKILRGIDEQKSWTELLASTDERIRLESLRYLCDRAYGKAPQAIELQASVEPWRILVEHIGG